MADRMTFPEAKKWASQGYALRRPTWGVNYRMVVEKGGLVVHFDGRGTYAWSEIVNRDIHEEADDWEFWGEVPKNFGSHLTPVKGSVSDPADFEKTMRDKRDKVFRDMW